MRKSEQEVLRFEPIINELDRAYAKHGRAPWTRHQAYAIILEELDEVWEAIKHDAPDEKLKEEVVQVAAMCQRFLETSIACSNTRNVWNKKAPKGRAGDRHQKFRRQEEEKA